jgi:hypothetical protein
MMIKYEVRTFTLETRTGKNAIDVWNNKDDQSTNIVGSFDDKESAISLYNTLPAYCKYCGNRLYFHEGKAIEINEYKDGEKPSCDTWVSGGDWLVYDLPDYKEPNIED